MLHCACSYCVVPFPFRYEQSDCWSFCLTALPLAAVLFSELRMKWYTIRRFLCIATRTGKQSCFCAFKNVYIIRKCSVLIRDQVCLYVCVFVAISTKALVWAYSWYVMVAFAVGDFIKMRSEFVLRSNIGFKPNLHKFWSDDKSLAYQKSGINISLNTKKSCVISNVIYKTVGLPSDLLREGLLLYSLVLSCFYITSYISSYPNFTIFLLV